MFLDVKPSVVFLTQFRLERIQCYANGAFSLNVRTLENDEKKLLLADASGNISDEIFSARQGVALANGYYILFEEPVKNVFLGGQKVFNGTIAEGTLFSPTNDVVAKGFDEYKVFPNNWFMLTYKEHKELYNDKAELVAKNFVDGHAFADNSYALRLDSPLYKTGTWAIYNETNSHPTIKRVVDFVGLNLILRQASQEGLLELVNQQGEVLSENIKSYNKFFNGYFSLTFISNCVALHSPEGARVSTLTGEHVKFLPDGTFVSYHQKMVDTRYQSNGLMMKEEIFQCEQASNYFLLKKENTTELYNEKGEVIDKDVLFATEKQNFALFQKDEHYHLYNQFGKVLEFNVI